MLLHRRTVIYLIGLISLAVPDCALQAADSFSDEVHMFRQRAEGRKYDTFTGTVFLKTSTGDLKSVLTDGATSVEWMHQCKEGRVLKMNDSRTRIYVYFIYNAPSLPWYLFMVPRPKDRDMVLRAQLREDDLTGNIYFNLINIDPEEEPALAGDPNPLNPELVQVNTLDIRWIIKQMDNGYLKVTLRVYSDPNHSGNDLGIIDRYTHEMVRKTLENIRDVIQERRS